MDLRVLREGRYHHPPGCCGVPSTQGPLDGGRTTASGSEGSVGQPLSRHSSKLFPSVAFRPPPSPIRTSRDSAFPPPLWMRACVHFTFSERQLGCSVDGSVVDFNSKQRALICLVGVVAVAVNHVYRALKHHMHRSKSSFDWANIRT
jgi:hypothetical protein